MALARLSDVYSKGKDLLNAFLEIDISESQVYMATNRIDSQTISDFLGEINHPQLQENQRFYASIHAGRPVPEHYSDGSRISEVKL